MVQVFLSYLNAAGAETRIELERYTDDISTFYLPDDVPIDLKLEHIQTATHSCTRLDMFDDNVALTRYSSLDRPVTLLTGEVDLQVPLSTDTIQRSYLLRSDDQFLTSAGRWQVSWDHQDQTSHSMRPPPLLTETDLFDQHIDDIEIPVIPSAQGAMVDDRYTAQENLEAHASQGVVVDEIRLSPPSLTGDQETIEHSSPALPGSYPEDVILPTEDDHGSSFISSTQDSVSTTGLATEEPFIPDNSMQRVTEAAGAHNLQHTSVDNGQAEIIETPQHGNDSLVTLNDETTVQAHASSDQSSPTNRIESELTASASEDETQPTRRDRVARIKRSFLEIEADDAPITKKPRREIHDSQMNEEDQDTITVSQDNSPAPSLVKKKKVATRSTAKSFKSAAKGQRSSITRDLQSFGPQADTVTPSRPSTRLASTPSSMPRASTADDWLSKNLQPVIVFSSSSEVHKDKKVMSSFRKLGGIVTDDISRATVLCVGNGALRKTSKLVIAVTAGKDIVTDRWLWQAHMQQKLPNPQEFLPRDKKHEEEWNFNLADAIERGKRGLDLLRGYDVHLTNRIQIDLGNLKSEVKQVAMTLGANKVGYSIPARRPSDRDMLVIGSPGSDEQGSKVNKLKVKMYNKDLLLLGALRGQLELDSDEFVIPAPVKKEA